MYNNTYILFFNCCALLKIIITIISQYIIFHNFVAFHIVCIYFHKLTERLCVRACVRADDCIRAKYNINLICDAAGSDRWTTACRDAVRIAALARFGGSFNCWFQLGNAPDSAGEMQHASFLRAC